MKQARSRKKGDFFKKLKLSTRMSLFLGVITFLFLTALLYGSDKLNALLFEENE